MRPLTEKKILILVQNLPVPFDRRVWQESQSLSQAGAEVTVICPSDAKFPEGEFDIDGIRVIRYKNPPEARGALGYVLEYGLSLLRMSRSARKARIRGRFDAVHFCNPPDLLYLVAARFKRRDGSVLVFDQHDLGPELVSAKRLPFGGLFVAVAKLFEAWTYRAADHVVATNESYKRIAMTRGRFSDEAVTVIRSGPSRTWADEPTPARDWHEGRQYLVGYLGVMGRQEGIEHLLLAHRELADSGLDVQLALVGSGPDRARLEHLVQALEIAERVTFHGRVDDTTLRSILANADVCVNPDEVNPMNDLSTMNKIIEYMALGKPIVQFDVREGRVSALESSLYADFDVPGSFGASIREVLQHPEKAAAMGEFGRERFMSELSWESQAERLVAMYTGLLENTPIRASASD